MNAFENKCEVPLEVIIYCHSGYFVRKESKYSSLDAVKSISSLFRSWEDFMSPKHGGGGMLHFVLIMSVSSSAIVVSIELHIFEVLICVNNLEDMDQSYA